MNEDVPCTNRAHLLLRSAVGGRVVMNAVYQQESAQVNDQARQSVNDHSGVDGGSK